MKKQLQALAAFVGLMSFSAMAAVPAGVDTAFDAIEADAVSLAAIAAPVLLAILGLTIVLKLIKRFANKV